MADASHRRMSTPVETANGVPNALRGGLARRAAEQRALWRHFARRWYVYLPAAAAWLVAQQHLLFNFTASLPYTVVWLHPGATALHRGDLIVYRYAGEALMQVRPGQRFFKRIAGVPGDRVSVEERRVLVNGAEVGIARQYTRDGQRLEPLPPGVIAAGYFYVQGTHAMSFDSRYRASGLVHASQILGRVDVIF
jgi:conjugal transfer pilin signal peptidase TrbI